MVVMIGVTSKMETKEIHVPKLFPTHTVRETLIVEKWYIREGDIIQPHTLMVSLETPPGFFDIPTPPTVSVPHRVIYLHVPENGKIKLNDPLITLEPVSESE